MQASYPERFERDMACSEAEWIAMLPGAIGELPWTRRGAAVHVQLGAGSLRIEWRPAPPRAIGLVRLPRLHVSFSFDGVGDAQRAGFMKRFDLYTHRGGG
jgi:hypothetical protein